MDEQSIFLTALEIETPETRAQWLAEACGADFPLKARIEALIERHREANSFLDKPPAEFDATIVPAAGQDLAGILQAGLAAAFSEDQSVVIGDAGHSVLQSIGQTLNKVPRVVLRDVAGGHDPVVRPNSPEIPKSDSDSRYQLQGEIARGGMGAIIKGRDTDLGRDLVIKVLLDSHKDKPEVIQRFVEEAQIGGQLQHPGIAPVYELGQFADKRPFFAMKLVKGETLSKLLVDREDAAADRGKFLGIFEQICQTMAYAHSRGVIHRDLKPANIMVGAFGEVQVMDWGLAKVLQVGGIADEKKSRENQHGQSVIQTRRGAGSDVLGSFGSSGSETQMGSVMGTPAYMPPEQALGEIDQLDERADVFGLGAILCEILTGKPPYVGTDGTAVYRQASRGKLDDCMTRLGTCGADAELIALTKQCLELEPRNRPRDAGVLAERVSAYLESVETRLRESQLAKVDAQVRAEELKRRQALTLVAGSAIVVSLVIGISASVWQAVRAEREATNARIAEQRAVDAFDELRTTAPAFASQARSLAEREEFDEAIEKLDYAIRLRPDAAEFLVAKGDLLQCQFKLALAAKCYREALRVMPGLARAEASVKLCDELLAAAPNAEGQLTRESLAKLHLAMQQQQRPAAELMPVARLLGQEKKLLVDYWLARLKDLPVSGEKPLKDRLTVRDDGRLALDLSDTKVSDLLLLDGAPLAELNLSRASELTDLSTLHGMKLVEINIRQTAVVDLTPLREMYTLKKLDMTASKVTDLSPLSELQLTSLTLRECEISDLTPIRKMPLDELNLRGTRVADISPLIGMPIKSLDLSMAPVLDFSPLAGLPLEKCFLQRNRIKDLSVLAGKPLKELVLWGCVDARNYAVLPEINTLELLQIPSEYRDLPVEDYEAIGALRSHPRLRQFGSEIMNQMGYAATGSKDLFWQDWDREQTFLPALRKSRLKFSLSKLPAGDYRLSISHQPVRDLSFLKGAPIGELIAMNCQITDLSPIEGMPLKMIHVFGNPISDLSPLRGMPLERAFLTATNVSDLSPLAGAPLRDLYLDSCRNLTDVSPLAEIPTLENLIFPPQVKNIETLRTLPKLRRLGLKGTGDSPIQADTTAEEFWKTYEPGALLKPGIVRSWNFESGTDGWRPVGYCELSAADGALRFASTGAGARMNVMVPPAPAEWSAFSFRARSSDQVQLGFYWSTTTHGESESHTRRFALGAGGKDWQEYHCYFRTDGNVTQLRLDFGDRAGQQVDFDWIRLERSNEKSLRSIAEALVQHVAQGSSTADDLAQLAQLLEALDGENGLKRYQEIQSTREGRR